jgi:cbb3-type cytochrome oxidase maturation protein
MTIIYLLAPLSLLLALAGLAAFWWTLRSGQYEDPMGDAARILDDHERDGPLQD